MIFYRFGSISGSIWESFWSYFWNFFGPGGRSEPKRRFSRNAMNSLCFFDILRVRGVQNLIIFGPGGDFFDVWKSAWIFHRFLKPKVRKVRDFRLHFWPQNRLPIRSGSSKWATFRTFGLKNRWKIRADFRMSKKSPAGAKMIRFWTPRTLKI